MFTYATLTLLVLATSTCIDFAASRYVRAVSAGQVRLAVLWTVLQWSSTMVGFVVAVRVSMWILPAEGLGLALGTYLGTRKGTRDRVCAVT